MGKRPTYAESSRTLVHRSFFRAGLQKKARPARPGQDPVHEYLIDQANLRCFRGAYSDRSDLGTEDPELRLEEIVVGLLHPAAPAEGRVLKLVVRMLQSGRLDLQRLHLLARRERALANLAWLVEQIPAEERTASIEDLHHLLKEQPPRERRWPTLHYDSSRLLRRKGAMVARARRR